MCSPCAAEQGFWANPDIGGAAGVFYKNGEQLGWQLAGICITVCYAAVLTAIIVSLVPSLSLRAGQPTAFG